jgi:hypothetical protein
MKRFFNITNHVLTDEQVKDIERRYGPGYCIQNMPPGIAALWANVPPEIGDQEVRDFLDPLIDWIQAASETRDDVALVQGEFGATYAMIDALLYHCNWPRDLICHATSKRESVDHIKPDGSVEKRAVFKHVRFRRYC